MEPLELYGIEKKVFEAIRFENSLGKVVDELFVTRNLAILTEDDISIQKVLTSLSTKAFLLQFQYGDGKLYICREYETIEAILKKWLEEENRILRSLMASTVNTQKQHLKFKQNVLDSINKTLSEHLQKIKEEEEEAELKDKLKTSTMPTLKNKIHNGTEQFLASFNIDELYSPRWLKNSSLITYEVSYFDLIRCIKYLISLGEIVEIPLSENNALFFDSSFINPQVVASIGEETRLAKVLANKESKDLKKTGKKLSKYNRYIQLDTVFKFLKNKVENQNQQTINSLDKPIIKNKTHPSDENSKELNAKSKVTVDNIKEANSPEVAIENKLEVDKVGPVNINELNKDQLLMEIKLSLDSHQLYLLLEEYYNGIENSKERIDIEYYYKTFFSCLGMLIKVPKQNNEKLYEIAKVFIIKIATIDNDLKAETLALIESQFDVYNQTIKNKELLSRFENLDD